MFKKVTVVAISLFICFGFSSAFAAPKKGIPDWGKQYIETSEKDLYAKYKSVTPAMVVEHLERGAIYLKKNGFKKAVEAFSQRPTKWNKGRQELYTGITNCTTGDINLLPVIGFEKIPSMKGILFKMKDRRGRHHGKQYCNKINTTKKKVVFQSMYHTFMGIPGFSMEQMLVGYPVEGTPYQIITQYPTEQYTEKQLNKMAF